MMFFGVFIGKCIVKMREILNHYLLGNNTWAVTGDNSKWFEIIDDDTEQYLVKN